MGRQESRRPNRKLAWERLERGWSYEELARRIRVQMREAQDPDTGLTANTVRRWETGERCCDPRYRRHLVSIFNKPASQLGLLTPDEEQLRPSECVDTEIRRLIDMAVEDVGNEGIERSAFLKSFFAFSSLPQLDALFEEDLPRFKAITGGNARADDSAADAVQQLVQTQRAMYWTVDPRTLYTAAGATRQLAERLLEASQTENIREKLCSAVSHLELLRGRLAFFDLHRVDAANGHYGTAMQASKVAGDHPVAAATLAHMSLIPGFAGDASMARERIQGALAHGWHGAGPRVRSWLHCVSSEIEARASNVDACIRHIKLAEYSLGREGTDPEWLDFYDESRLDCFAGYSTLVAGDTERAEQHLTKALSTLNPSAVKQRTVLLADLAAARGSADPDAGWSLLGEATEILQQSWYATGYQRITEVEARLGARKPNHDVSEQIRSAAER